MLVQESYLVILIPFFYLLPFKRFGFLRSKYMGIALYTFYETFNIGDSCSSIDDSWGGSCQGRVNVSALTRMHDIETSNAMGAMGPEANLESLLYPKISASSTASSIISRNQDTSCKTGLQLTSSDAREFICGWGAAVINVTVTYPINKIIFRQILEGVPVGAAVKQLSREGLRLLYRGILPPLCQKTLSLSIMFGVYEGSRKRICLLTNNEILAKFFAANIAGSAEAVLMPLERVQTLLQDWRYHDKFKNTSHAFRHLLNHHGISECYRGLVPILFRNGLSNVMFFSLRDRSKMIIADHDTLLYNFISGALIGGFTSTVFYPMNVIKIHMQTKIGGNFEKFWIVVREIYVSRDKSIAHFYKGVHLNYMRSFISWGVINAAYDFLKKIILV